MERVKKIVLFWFLLLLMAGMAGCASAHTPAAADTEEAEGTVSEQAESRGKEQLPSDLEDWQREELEGALKDGFWLDAFDGRLQEPVTEKELLRLLGHALELASGECPEEWKTVESKGADETIRRQHAAEHIAQALLTLKVERVNFDPGCDPNRSWCYGEELDGTGFDLGDYESYTIWPPDVTGQVDLRTGRRVMEVTEDYYFRAADLLTVEEAVLAAYRLAYSIVPEAEYVNPADVEPMILTEELQKAAALMPDVSYDALPAWTGCSFYNNGETEIYGDGPRYFGEFQVRDSAEIGFDFARVQLNWYLYYDNEESGKIDQNKLKNLDDLISWGMEYGVHICLSCNALPGFGASYCGDKNPDGDFWENSEKQEIALEYYRFLARHYRNIPAEALSFNFLNEPYSAPDKKSYCDFVRRATEAVLEISPDRLLFADGWTTDEFGPSTEPIPELADLPVAQSFHYYTPHEITSGGDDYAFYEPNGWPIPYVNGCISGTPLTVNGDFKEGTEIRIVPGTVNLGNVLYVETDGKRIAEFSYERPEEGSGGCVFADYENGWAAYETENLVTLPEDCSQIKIGAEGISAEPYMQILDVSLIHPEISGQTVLFFHRWDEGGMVDEESRKVTRLLCSTTEANNSREASVITVNEDGSYFNAAQQELEWNAETMRGLVKVWKEFSEETGVGVMCQEFAAGSRLPYRIARAWWEDSLVVLTEEKIPWSAYTSGGYGCFYPIYYDAEAGSFHGRPCIPESVEMFRKYSGRHIYGK